MAALTGSVSLLSEAIHSALDLVSSTVTFFSIRESARPPDHDHPFGHGKIESLSATFEAVLLLLAAAYIAYEGASKLRGGSHHVENLGWGLGVAGVSVLVNVGVYVQNRGVASAAESLAIETNAFHFLTDAVTSLAVFIGLGLLKLTGFVFIDAVVALVIACYVFWIGVKQIGKCLAELSDTALPDDEIRALREILDAHQAEFLGYHNLRARRVGALRHIELHLEMCSEQKVAEAHRVCDRIEEDLGKRFHESDVNIHVEPCGNHGPSCAETCRFYKQARVGGSSDA